MFLEFFLLSMWKRGFVCSFASELLTECGRVHRSRGIVEE